MPKTESSESDNAGSPRPKAHDALQPQDAAPATNSAEDAQHSRKKHKSSKQPSGAEIAAQVQAKAASYVQQLAAPDPEIAKTGTMAIAEKRQKDYNKHMQAKPWGDTSDTDFDPTGGALALAGEQTKDSVFKDSAEARRLPGWQAPPSAESSQRHQPPQNQLRSFKEADDSSATARSHTSLSHGEDNKQNVQGNGSSRQEGAQQPQAEGDAQMSHQDSLSGGGGDTHSRGGRQRSDAEDAQQPQGGAQTSQGSSGMSEEIEECNQRTNSKKAKEKDEGHGGHAAEASKATQDRLHDEQTQQHHPQNDCEDSKSLPPVVQQLQKAQQRAHDEMEAAEKKSSDMRFPAEAGQRFVTNARKHKSKLDATVFEHGTNVRSSEIQQ